MTVDELKELLLDAQSATQLFHTEVVALKVRWKVSGAKLCELPIALRVDDVVLVTQITLLRDVCEIFLDDPDLSDRDLQLLARRCMTILAAIDDQMTEIIAALPFSLDGDRLKAFSLRLRNGYRTKRRI